MPLDDPGRLRPPGNNEAEIGLLGALLISNAAYGRVSEILRPEHFAEEVHGRIYAAIATMIDRGSVANVVTLRNLFDQDGALAEIGGGAYLARLAASVVTIVNAPHYAAVIRDCWARREGMRIAEDLHAGMAGEDIDVTPAQLIEQAEQELFELADPAVAGGSVSLAASARDTLKAIEGNFKRGGALRGITTGIPDLDRKLGGLIPGRLYLLGGRPSMGKTSLALGMAFDTARAGNGVGFFSLEMPHADLTSRLMGRLTGIATDRLDAGQVEENDFYQLVDATEALGRLPIHIDDTSSLSLPRLRQAARRMVRKHDIKLIVVDYLQIMAGSSDAERRGRFDVVTQLSGGLKALAKELALPVLLLSQLSRKVEDRDNKRPMLSDLRESGSIEQDADVVMFIFREDYYLEREEPAQRSGEKPEAFSDRLDAHRVRVEAVRGVAEVIAAKNKHGSIGTVRCQFDLIRQRFTQMAVTNAYQEAAE